MPCAFPDALIKETIAFHGHSCPGLAIGIRAVELAFRELGRPEDTNMVAVAETDMCGVDAIQFLTDCTYGKGNFLHRDYGKMAFSFFDRNTGKGFRAVLNPEAWGEIGREMGELTSLDASGKGTPEIRERLMETRRRMQDRYMDLDLDDMFLVAVLTDGPPRPARILESLVCKGCGETVMESRTRRMGGETFCIPCFERREQKV
ncbi:MAG: TraR/DksA C4-type zinc finger protein [Desulfovibrionaceae bacterium]|nr:TraR/DksA C4-type zinc finger protein [Desulfovibrionaceae bacterium]